MRLFHAWAFNFVSQILQLSERDGRGSNGSEGVVTQMHGGPEAGGAGPAVVGYSGT
jgi:hypothetical protein